MRQAIVILLVIGLASSALAADNLSFSVVTSTGKVPVTGMASYKLAETEGGSLSAWADVLYISTDDSLALGLSARHDALSNLLPLVKGGGFCAYWSFQHECFKGRLYIINMTF